MEPRIIEIAGEPIIIGNINDPIMKAFIQVYKEKQPNMEKKYKLIKDLEVPGKIWYIDSKDVPDYVTLYDIKTIGEWTKIMPWLIGNTIAKSPEWFELVEEKEFTRSDMIKFAREYSRDNNGRPNDFTDAYLTVWLKTNKS